MHVLAFVNCESADSQLRLVLAFVNCESADSQLTPTGPRVR